MKKKPPIVIAILDGFGLADFKDKGNAITPKTAPHIFSYIKKYPSTKLHASGQYVGLYNEQQGNSEAGHLNIGGGRIVKQDLCYISDAIKDGSFFKNKVFQEAIDHSVKNKSSIHVMGLLTTTNSAHAQIEHLYAILKLLDQKKVKNVYIHLFTDGRDTAPFSSLHFIQTLAPHLHKHQKVATIMGRFYAMDRAKNWERTKQAYQCLVLAKGNVASSVEQAIADAYAKGESDEYISPTIIDNKDKQKSRISDGDSVIFFNARSDRARQLAKTFVQKSFNKKNPNSFKTSKVLKEVCFVAMTDFGPDLPLLRAFPSANIDNALAKAIGEDRKQLYISEMEKYAHVTYFMNGGFAQPINGEVREVITSHTDRNFARNPQMKTASITKKIIAYIQKGTYDFVLVNFPNADMVGHTGNLDATKKAITFLDTNIAILAKEILKLNGTFIITADHGNAEEMINKKTGDILTEHTTNMVPFVLISKQQTKLFGKKIKLKHEGILADIAPTILQYIGKPIPKEMTGVSLIR